MRRLGTDLFLYAVGLYKARAARGHMPSSFSRRSGHGAAYRSLFYDGNERNHSMAVTLSVVVPVKDEAENAGPLAREIAAALVGETAPEIIFIDDGSTDSTAQTLRALKGEIPALRVIQHGRNIGQSRAIRTGVREARADIIVTLDGDGQNDPADMMRLVTMLREADPSEKVALVSGIRRRRKDTASKRFASGFANGFRRWMLNDGAIDSGCGLKVFHREAFLALPYFDHMHRFLVALMLREHYQVRFVEVNHRARAHGQSKYKNFHRAMVGLVDTFGVRWLQTRYRGTAEPKEL